MAATTAQYEVNQITPDADVAFDRKVGEQYVKYGHMLAGRGFIQSSLGNMAIRAPHPKYPDGVC